MLAVREEDEHGDLQQNLTRLEEQNGNLPEVKVDEMFRLVGDVAAEIAADDAVPGGRVFFVELLLDECRDVLFNVVLLKSLGGDVNSILLHLFGHVGILDHCLAVRHFDPGFFPPTRTQRFAVVAICVPLRSERDFRYDRRITE